MFYENFDRICRERNTSASAAALAIGKAKNTAGGWKRNGTIPKEDELIALAKHLRCRVADFFREDGQVHFKSREEMIEYWEYIDSINPITDNKPQRVEYAYVDLNQDESDFADVYRACTKKQQKELMVCVYQFAEENGIEYEDD